MKDIRPPVEVIWGEKDGWLDPSQAKTLVRKIPGSRLRLVSDAGHFVMEDAPESVAGILAEFFAADRA